MAREKKTTIRIAGIDGTVALLLFLVSFLHLAQFSASPDARGIADEGFFLNVIQRMSSGELIYRDFFWAQTPLSGMILQYVVFPAFGMTLESARVFTAVQGGFLAAVTFLLARTLIASRIVALFPPLLFIFFGFHNWNNVSHHWFCLSFLLPGLYLLEGHIRSPRRPWLLVLAGFLGALAFLCLQPDGIIFLATGCAFLLLGTTGEDSGPLGTTLRFAAAAAGTIAAFAVFFCIFARTFPGDSSLVSLARPLVYDCFIWPMTSYARFNALPRYFYFGNEIIEDFARRVISPHSTVEFLVSFSGVGVGATLGYAPFPALACSAAYLWNRRRKWGHTARTLLLYTIYCALSLVGAVLTRPDPLRIIYFSPVTFCIFFFFLEKGLTPTMGRFGKPARTAIMTFMAILGATIVAWGISWAYSTHAHPGYAVTFPRGPLTFPTREKADEFSSLLGYIDTHTREGDYVYVHGWSPQYYFLLNRRNPSPYDFLIPVQSTPSQIREAVARLEEHRPRYVIYDAKIETLMRDPAGDVFPSVTREDLTDNPMVPYIHSHYRSIRGFSALGLSLLERTGP